LGPGGYRLPTGAEWEYACRAGTTTQFNTGNSITARQANFCRSEWNWRTKRNEGYRERTIPVGSFAPNTWGLYDMHGNVWEWSWDWLDDDRDPYPSYSAPYLKAYTKKARTDPSRAVSGYRRVNRGGSWFNIDYKIDSAWRDCDSPMQRINTVGFRVARNAE
jgi:formylglycine-generating enzyme required for sulfatase activity